ncbi:glycosyltransferase [Kiritimatiellota bacterium B12222]|nr:glycosyltransferase [Kiritimatiellota bacterium B12222]
MSRHSLEAKGGEPPRQTLNLIACILIQGNPAYSSSGKETILSVLQHTDLDLHAFIDRAERITLPPHKRLHLHALPSPDPSAADGMRFLVKCEALRQLSTLPDVDGILMLDADTVIVKSLSLADLSAPLHQADWAISEQTGIRGTEMTRQDFLEHYTHVSLAYCDPTASPPDLADFRYVNTGVFLVRIAALLPFLDWTENILHQKPSLSIDGKLIGDQDLIQYWIHHHPGLRFQLLDASWNHCPLWHHDFPTAHARIVHLSNFLLGPTMDTSSWLRAFRQQGTSNALPFPTEEDAPPIPPWPGLLIVIVTYRSATTLETTLNDAMNIPGASVVVVDNHSDDESAALAMKAGATVISLKKNVGFAKAVNRAVTETSSQDLLLLNPDCQMPAAVASQALTLLQENPKACCSPDLNHGGLIIPGVQQGYSRRKIGIEIGEDTPVVPSRLQNLIQKTPGYHRKKCPWILGTALFCKRETFAAAGGLDEHYFLYMEDVVFGETLSRKGHPMLRVPACVTHIQQSGSNIPHAQRRQLLREARIQYARIHYGNFFTQSLLYVLRKRGASL